MKIVCFGELLLRLGAVSPAILGQTELLQASYCGAEANVAVALAGFGHAAQMVTALPEGRIGQGGITALRSFGVVTNAVVRAAGRMGLLFLSPAAMIRPAEVIYDRAGSVFAETAADAYDWPALLAEADWLFVTGITAALGDQALSALRDAMAAARQRGVKIAFDCNYRPSLWRGREDLARHILLDLSCQADLLFAGRRAIGLLLGTAYPDEDAAAGFTRAAQDIFARAPHIAHVAATRRDIAPGGAQQLMPLLAGRDGLGLGDRLVLDGIIDRIGTGDAFAAGIVHGLSLGMDLAATARFGAACAWWAHSVEGDFLRASLTDIEDLLATGGSADVRR